MPRPSEGHFVESAVKQAFVQSNEWRTPLFYGVVLWRKGNTCVQPHLHVLDPFYKWCWQADPYKTGIFQQTKRPSITKLTAMPAIRAFFLSYYLLPVVPASHPVVPHLWTTDNNAACSAWLTTVIVTWLWPIANPRRRLRSKVANTSFNDNGYHHIAGLAKRTSPTL
jgi:hypothetical protein